MFSSQSKNRREVVISDQTTETTQVPHLVDIHTGNDINIDIEGTFPKKNTFKYTK